MVFTLSTYMNQDLSLSDYNSFCFSYLNLLVKCTELAFKHGKHDTKGAFWLHIIIRQNIFTKYCSLISDDTNQHEAMEQDYFK